MYGSRRRLNTIIEQRENEIKQETNERKTEIEFNERKEGRVQRKI